MKEACLVEIGHVTVQFALLEMQAAFAVGSLLLGGSLDSQRLGQIVTAELSFQKRVHLLAALWRYRNPTVDDRALKRICADLFAAEQERNKIIHSTWLMAEADKLLRVKTTAKGRLSTKSETVAPGEIRAIAEKISEAGSKLTEFLFPATPGGKRLSDVL